jgi:ABC-type multidrug transport system fused ATPase/permease subunit
MMSAAIRFFLKRHQGIYAWLVCALVVSALLEALSVGALFPLVAEVLGSKQNDSGGRVLSALHAALTVSPVSDPVLGAVFLLVALVTLKAVTTLCRDYLTAAGSAQVVCEVKQDLFFRLLRAPYQYFFDHRHEELSYRLTSAPQSLGLTLLLLSSLVSQGVIILAICALLITISWQLTGGLMVIGGLLYLALRNMAKRVSHVVGRQRTSALTREIGVVSEYLAGIKEIMTGGNGSRWLDSYRKEGDFLRTLYVKDGLWQSVPGVAIEWVFFLLIGVLAGVQHGMGQSGSTAAFPVMAVYSYAVYRMIRALSLMSAYKLRLASQSSDIELLYRALQEEFPEQKTSGRKPVCFSSSLAFDNVSFRYPNRSDYALRQVTLAIQRGTTTAIVGQSGSGKTTLMNLLLCLYAPTEGRLLLDGEDLSDYDSKEWLMTVGYVSQEAFLINDTIAENIRFGHAGCSRADVEAAGHAAYVDEFVRDLPQGYETVVGARGMALSGGQRQRIAIARALVRRPQILIFDEATSALDEVSEAMIQRAMDELKNGYTMIVIAHRVSTVRNADRIIVMEGGRIIEIGTHDELVASRGRYSFLMASSLA